MQRCLLTESTRGSAWYGPVSKQACVTSRLAVVTSAAAPATTIVGTGSEQLTDGGRRAGRTGQKVQVCQNVSGHRKATIREAAPSFVTSRSPRKA